jgi:hypothetical protein
MKYPYLKTAHFSSTKFMGVKEFYIVENNDDLKALINVFPRLRSRWILIQNNIKKIISEGYVAVVTDMNEKTDCIEVYYENKIPHVYNYTNAFNRVEV